MSDETGAPVLVSACLAGIPCRYDGASKPQRPLEKWAQGRPIVLICPEVLGGLSTPRPPAELRGGDGASVLNGSAKVIRIHDEADVTAAFLKGARLAYEKAPHATQAILKARSPSCGCGETHIDGEVQAGDGVFAALLRSKGITLFTDETPPPFIEQETL